MNELGPVVIVDRNNHRVVSWSPGAAVGIVIAGGHGPGSELCQLHCPEGCALDADGGLFVADTLNDRIVHWPRGARQGRVVAGGRREGEVHLRSGRDVGHLKQPNDVQLTRAGAMVITETSNRHIIYWEPGSEKGRSLHYAEGSFDGCYIHYNPRTALLDDDGSVIIADAAEIRFLRWHEAAYGSLNDLLFGDADGAHVNKTFHYPSPFQRGPVQERLIVAMEGDGVACCPQGAEAVCLIAGGTGESRDRNQLGRPTAVALGRDGVVIVADGANHCIMCCSLDAGQWIVIAGGNGAGERMDQLDEPVSVLLETYRPIPQAWSWSMRKMWSGDSRLIVRAMQSWQEKGIHWGLTAIAGLLWSDVLPFALPARLLWPAELSIGRSLSRSPSRFLALDLDQRKRLGSKYRRASLFGR